MDERQFRIEMPGSGTVSAVAMRGAEPDAVYVFAHGAGADMNHVFMRLVAAGLAAPGIWALKHDQSAGQVCHDAYQDLRPGVIPLRRRCLTIGVL